MSVVIHALRAVVLGGAGRLWLMPVMVMVLYRQMGRILGRVERLAARFAAGTLRVASVSSAGVSSARISAAIVSAVPVDVSGEKPARAKRVLPVRFGWLVDRMGWQVAGYGSQLRAVLETPEMVALLTAAPQAGRILQPLCRMLAIEVSVLRPWDIAVAGDSGVMGGERAAHPLKPKRVRVKRPPIDWGRIPLPRGVLTWARRERARERNLERNLAPDKERR